MYRRGIGVIACVLLLSCSSEDGMTSDSCSGSSYTDDVLPIIEMKCSIPACHDVAFQYGDFTDYIELKEVALDGGLWIQIAVAGQMPPEGQPDLTREELDKIKCWIDAGALFN